MYKTGIANLPLHTGTVPRWLFKRMVSISGEILEILTFEYGIENVLTRFSSPFFFQAFSSVIGFDWHSSGTTTVVMSAIKEALKSRDLGIAVIGGKSRSLQNIDTELSVLDEKFNFSNIEQIKYASKITAKVDNHLVQDGFTLYHHTLFVTENGTWSVIQQGLNVEKKYARRYHWLGSKISSFVNDPHTAIESELILDTVLDLSAGKSKEVRDISVDLVNDGIEHIKPYIATVKSNHTKTLDEYMGIKVLKMPWTINWSVLRRAYEIQPDNYEQLIAIPGVGAKTVRALAYIANIVYGAEPSWTDPAKYSFAVGGKDGVPNPIDIKTYDQTIEILKNAINNAKLGDYTKLHSLKRLKTLIPK